MISTFKALAITGTLIGGALVESSGYTILNTSDGKNILCDLDPNCRKLNDNEIEIATRYFGDQVDYRQVNIISRPSFSSVFNNLAVAGQNGIFLGKELRESNMESDIEKMSYHIVFVHEMAHIHQYQNHKHFGSYLGSMLGDRGYEYDLSDHETFIEYGVEQEASIVQHIATLDYIAEHPDIYRGRPSVHANSPYFDAWLERNIRIACSKDAELLGAISQTTLPLEIPQPCPS